MLILMHFKMLMYEMFWVRKGKPYFGFAVFFLQLSDVAAWQSRSFKAGLDLVVQPQCMCCLANMTNLILTKRKQCFGVENEI